MSVDTTRAENIIEEGGQALEQVAQTITDATDGDAAVKENDQDVIDEENVNELDQARSDESEVEDESALEDTDMDKDTIVKQGNKVW